MSSKFPGLSIPSTEFNFRFLLRRLPSALSNCRKSKQRNYLTRLQLSLPAYSTPTHYGYCARTVLG